MYETTMLADDASADAAGTIIRDVEFSISEIEKAIGHVRSALIDLENRTLTDADMRGLAEVLNASTARVLVVALGCTRNAGRLDALASAFVQPHASAPERLTRGGAGE